MNLSAADVIDIAGLLQQVKEGEIGSISFSYNTNLGDTGALALASGLPHTIREIGLVSCGIGAAGVRAILEWVKVSPLLKMICIEQNNFSVELKNEFQQLSERCPHLLVVV